MMNLTIIWGPELVNLIVYFCRPPFDDPISLLSPIVLKAFPFAVAHPSKVTFLAPVVTNLASLNYLADVKARVIS